MRGLLIFILLFFNFLSVQAYELVLPKDKKNVTTSNYALFVGKAKRVETMSINGHSIYTAPNGAFAHSIPLKEGENRIIIKSNYNTKIYTFYKTVPTIIQKPVLEEFEIIPVTVINDNTPLRNTPIDAGLNRIAHLFCNTTLLINGSKGDFYRVYLSKDKEAWIAKKDVCVNYDKQLYPAEFLGLDTKSYKNATVQSISFTKNLPYSVEETGKEILFRVYNSEKAANSVYTLTAPKTDKYTYNISLKDGQYNFKVSSLPSCIEDITVIIDAGHGGSEMGAIGCLGTAEKDINLKIALELEKILKKKGFNVVMTRTCDCNVDLQNRVDIAKKNDANIFISIHLNSIGDIPINLNKNKGTSVYYYNPNSKDFAEVLERSVSKFAGTKKDGVKTASFAVIRPTNYMGVLIECAYMINPHDSMLYLSRNFPKNVAKGITEGIIKYIDEQK